MDEVSENHSVYVSRPLDALGTSTSLTNTTSHHSRFNRTVKVMNLGGKDTMAT
jgi:hypothetical protein